jgi:hypothetical protein
MKPASLVASSGRFFFQKKINRLYPQRTFKKLIISTREKKEREREREREKGLRDWGWVENKFT